MAGAAGRPRRHHRSARRALVGIPLRAPRRRTGGQGPHPRRLPVRHQGLRRRVLRAVEDGSRQHRPAAADGARADVGSVGARQDSRLQPARGERRRLHRQLHQRLQLPRGRRPVDRPSVRHHRHRELDHRQPGVVLLRLPRTLDGHRHRLLVVAGRRARRGEGAARRGRRRGAGRRRQRPGHPAGDGRLRRGGRRAGARRPDQVVLGRRRRLRPLRGRRHAGAQAPGRRAPRRRRDPRRHRRWRGQPRRPLQRPAGAEPGCAGSRAAQGLQGRRHRSAHRRLRRGARHRHHPR